MTSSVVSSRALKNLQRTAAGNDLVGAERNPKSNKTGKLKSKSSAESSYTKLTKFFGVSGKANSKNGEEGSARLGTTRLDDNTDVNAAPMFQAGATACPKKVDVGTQVEPSLADCTSESPAVCATEEPTSDYLRYVDGMLDQLNAPPDYWETIAEQRRVALAEALQENLKFYQEILSLREMNTKLKFLADEGQKYAQLLKVALDSEDS